MRHNSRRTGYTREHHSLRGCLCRRRRSRPAVGPVDEVGPQRNVPLDGLLLRDGNGYAGGNSRWLGKQRRVPGGAAPQEAARVCEIGAGQIWSRVAAMADRRVVRDELLLDEVCGVQAGSEGLQSDEARHKTHQSLPSRQFSKRGHA
jgi:hypothetical protein